MLNNWQRGMVFGLALLLLGIGGCGLPMGGFLTDDPPKEVPPAVYAGLPGQQVGIMVWAASPIRTEFNQVQLDLARVLQNKLTAKLEPEKEKNKKSAAAAIQFINPGSIVRYQREHPQYDGLPIVEYAPKLGRNLRLIYIELEEFQVQSPQSLLLLKGTALATLRVVEVNDGQSQVVLEEKDLRVFYPKDAPAGVVATDQINETTVYQHTVTSLAEKLALRFERKG